MDEAHVQSQKNIYLRWKVPLHKKGYNQYVIMPGYIAPKGFYERLKMNLIW